MKRYMATCTFEVMYVDGLTEDQICKSIERRYIKTERLERDTNERFTIVQLEEIDEQS